jgi:PIN domain nuclease of toxin-antitoxin system
MNFVTDTHTLVWYFQADSRIGAKALKAFQETLCKGRVIVPTVVLAEIMYIARRGRIALSFNETLGLIQQANNFVISPLDVEVLLIADRIQANLEMHDRLIVATAIKFKAPLLTKDEVIRASGVVKTVW